MNHYRADQLEGLYSQVFSEDGRLIVWPVSVIQTFSLAQKYVLTIGAYAPIGISSLAKAAPLIRRRAYRPMIL